MSYEYARIPLKAGLNIICGPNGSGKSSILLAISVALGQAYTERSRKLSDLIRRGRDMARVSLLFDNKAVDGKRPIPFSKSDSFMLSRYLRSDGSYWYEADYRDIGKGEIVNLFKGSGLNPDNMLIIMHQGMIEEFAITTPQQKLKLVEEAVGFQKFRENILDAQSKLSGLASEEDVLRQTLDNAGQTLDYWKDIYDRYLTKKDLAKRKQFLTREAFWAQVIKHEKAILSLESKLQNRRRILGDTQQQLQRTSSLAEEMKEQLASNRVELRKLYFSLSHLEGEKSESRLWTRIQSTERVAFQKALKLIDEVTALSGAKPAETLKQIAQKAGREIESLATIMEEASRKDRHFGKEIVSVQAELAKADDNVEKNIEKYVAHRVKEAVLEYRVKGIEREIHELDVGVRENKDELTALQKESGAATPRIDTDRISSEVSEDLKVVSAQLMSMSDVPEEAEKLYNNYSSTYEELKTKLHTLSENKAEVTHELNERTKVWRIALERLAEEINPVYREILSTINAAGEVRLSDLEDINTSGLELLVGFRGTQPVILDAYTQSGGERSVSIVAFLLSLQERLLSPFRAIDEFDVHMDPRNREAMFQMIFSHADESGGSQYVVITPSQITVTDPKVHIITVQNSQRGSRPRRTET